jgi:hypothetical protein
MPRLTSRFTCIKQADESWFFLFLRRIIKGQIKERCVYVQSRQNAIVEFVNLRFCAFCSWPSRVVGLIEDLAPVISMLSEVARDKLQRFVSRLSFCMSEQLQALVVNSLDEFKKYWEFYRIRKSDHGARPSQRRHASVYGGIGKSMADNMQSLFQQDTPKEPLFRLFLIVEGDRLVFKPSIELIHKTTIELLDNMVTSIQGTEGLQSRLRSLFSYDTEPAILQSVSLDDPRVVDARKTTEVLRSNWSLNR